MSNDALADLTNDLQSSPVPVADLTPEKLIIPANEKNTELIAKQLEKADPMPALDKLTDQDRSMITNFQQSVNFADPQNIMLYGAETKNAAREISRQALENVRTKDAGIPGEEITNMIQKMKGFGQPTGNFLERIKQKGMSLIQRYRTQYSSLEKSLDNFEQLVMRDMANSMKHINTAAALKTASLERRHIANLQILAGQQAIADFRAKLPVRQAEAAASADPMEAKQKLEEEITACEDFELFLSELMTVSSMCLQNAARNTLQERNARNQARTSSTIINTTIPMFRDMAMVYILSEEQKTIADNQAMIADATNELALRTAELTDSVSVQVEKQALTPTLRVDTIQKTGQSFVDTLEKIRTIRDTALKANAENQTLLAEVDKKLLEATVRRGEITK